MKPLRHWVFVCLLLPALCAAQTFRSDVNLVSVGFSVRDAAGKLNPNLTQNDFEILEDGVPQRIAFFARSVDVPLNLGLVVDISGSQATFVKSHQRDLRIFLDEVLRADDRAFLVSFSNHPRLVVNYTANGRELVNALEGYQGVRDKSAFPMLGPMEIRSGGTAFYDAIFHSANQMFQNTDRGRRALVVFSDGEENTSAHHMMDAIEVAQANNVLLFCIRYTELHGRWTAKKSTARASWSVSDVKPAARITTLRRRTSPNISVTSANSFARLTKWPIIPRIPSVTVRSTKSPSGLRRPI